MCFSDHFAISLVSGPVASNPSTAELYGINIQRQEVRRTSMLVQGVGVSVNNNLSSFFLYDVEIQLGELLIKDEENQS